MHGQATTAARLPIALDDRARMSIVFPVLNDDAIVADREMDATAERMMMMMMMTLMAKLLLPNLGIFDLMADTIPIVLQVETTHTLHGHNFKPAYSHLVLMDKLQTPT